MKEATKNSGRRLVRPLVELLVRTRLSPNAVTLAALPLAAGAGVLFGLGRFVWAGVLAAAAGLCDTLDGELSRLSGRVTRTGGFLDSVTDRLGEAATLSGLLWYYQERNHWYGLLALSALVFSLMVSYVRARAEGAGFDCKVGWFERPVRVLVLLAGAFLLGRTWMPIALGVITLGSMVTVIHRIAHVVSQRQCQ